MRGDHLTLGLYEFLTLLRIFEEPNTITMLLGRSRVVVYIDVEREEKQDYRYEDRYLCHFAGFPR